MQTLIDDVLAYSKIDLQGIEFQLMEVETALNRALTDLRGRIKETETDLNLRRTTDSFNR